MLSSVEQWRWRHEIGILAVVVIVVISRHQVRRLIAPVPFCRLQLTQHLEPGLFPVVAVAAIVTRSAITWRVKCGRAGEGLLLHDRRILLLSVVRKRRGADHWHRRVLLVHT